MDLVIENRFSHMTFQIRRNLLAPNIRRYSGLTTFNITNRTDYVIIKPFEKLQPLLAASFMTAKEKQKALRGVESGDWEDFVKDHSSNIALIYRARISNANHLAFYSTSPMFMGGSFWMVNYYKHKASKVALPLAEQHTELVSVVCECKETEGAWMWIDQYVMENFLMPNLLEISDKDVVTLLKIFDELGKEEFPTLLEQFSHPNPMRRKIDAAFLSLMGLEKKEINSVS